MRRGKPLQKCGGFCFGHREREESFTTIYGERLVLEYDKMM